MKILFIGSVQFSYHLLEHLLLNNAQIAGICSTKSSQWNADYCDLSPLANSHNIPLHLTTDLGSQSSLKWIRKIGADIIFCFGWSRIINSEVLSMTPMGVIGYHPTLLPKNRGRHPIIWALVLGLEVTGSTFFFLDNGVDSGPIISQKKVKISSHDSASTLYEKLIQTAKCQLSEILNALSRGKLVGTEQDEGLATYWRRRTPSDGLIDWRMDAKSIYNLIRALADPYPNAEFSFAGVNYKVKEGSVLFSLTSDAEPGKVIRANANSFVVKCGAGAIVIKKTDPAISIALGDYIL